jgi:hypothetical protein
MLPPADGTEEAPAANPVATQISNLEQAFALSPRRVAAR